MNDKIVIGREVFEENRLPYLSDDKKIIRVQYMKGNYWLFKFSTNTPFFIDDKRFFMVVLDNGKLHLLTSSFLAADVENQIRTFYLKMPDDFSAVYSIGYGRTVIVDIEGDRYEFSIENL